MATAGRISGTVIQALRWLGKRNVDDRVVSGLRRGLSQADKEQLAADEALKGDRKGQYSIRINDQWRICFEWPEKSPGPTNVEIVDYH
jgi:Txe/YoeB family toxin of Txe-Axe toxin-antitoxin module